MSAIDIDPIILGDNQFFGVNHMSESKGMATRKRFKDVAEIRKVLFTAMDNGIEGVFFSTHPDIYKITAMMRADPAIKRHFNIYVNVPYIMKYISMLNTMGIPETIRTVLAGRSIIKNVYMFVQGALNLVKRDYLSLANRLVEVELSPFHGLKLKAIFLHNSLCDLALGYGMTIVLSRFDEHVRKRLKLIPAYGTQNYPAFKALLEQAGLDGSLVMTAVNKLGFYMNPGISGYEQAFKDNRNTVIAMATLASGRLEPDEAYAWLASMGIKHVVVGLSSKAHADQTFSAIRRYILA